MLRRLIKNTSIIGGRFLYLLAIALLTILLNAVSFTSKAFADSPNLVANNSAEVADPNNPLKPQSWTADSWGSLSSNFEYSSVAHSGAKSLKVTVSSYSSGDAKWFFDPIQVTPNTNYTFSNWFQSSVYTDYLMQTTNIDGSRNYQWLGGQAASADWKNYQQDFRTSPTAKTITIFQLLAGNGWLQTDDYSVSLAAPPIAPVVDGSNVLLNPSLETAQGNTPQAWSTNKSRVNTSSFAYLSSGARDGSRAIQVKTSSYTSGDAFWEPQAALVAENTTYEYTNWYKSTVNTDIYAHITNQDNSEQWRYVGTAMASPGWNKFYAQFTMPAGAKKAAFYQSLAAVGTLTTDAYDLHVFRPTGFSRGLVSITFDDSIRSNYTYALPLLTKYNLTSTNYMISGLTTDPYYMDKTMMLAFKQAGQEIGSHTVSHPHLTQVTSSKLNTELSASRSGLATITGSQPANFASPYGEYNSTTLAKIKQYYRSHRGVEPGYNAKNNFDIYDLKVQNIVATTTVGEVQSWLAQAAAQKTWLILVYHATDPSADIPDNYWNTTPSQLEQHFQAIAASGLAVRTVNQALDEITPQL